jgi:hypothetical protein
LASTYSINCDGAAGTDVAIPQPAVDALNQHMTEVANNKYDTMTVVLALEQNPVVAESRGTSLSLNLGPSGVAGQVVEAETVTVRTTADALAALTIANDRGAPFQQINSTVVINPCTNTLQRLDQMEYAGGGNVASRLVRQARVNGNIAGQQQWEANYPHRTVPTAFQPEIGLVTKNKIY